MALRTSYYNGKKYFSRDTIEVIEGKTYSVITVDVRHLSKYYRYNVNYIEPGWYDINPAQPISWEVLIYNDLTYTGMVKGSSPLGNDGNLYYTRINIDNRFTPFIGDGITTFKARVTTSAVSNALSDICLTSESLQNLSTLTDLKLDNTIVDDPILVTWKDTNNVQSQLWLTDSNNNVVYEKLLMGETSHTIPANALEPGDYILNIQPFADYAVKDNIYFGQLGAETSKAITLIQVAPRIIALEPNNIPQNKDEDILVSWSSVNQQEYELNVKLDGVLINTYTGATEKSVNIAKGTLLTTGTVEMTLTVKYMPIDGTLEEHKRIATKTSTFLLFGKPATPTITSGNAFDTSKPTITWKKSSEQVAFQISVYKGSIQVFNSGLVYNTSTSYQITQPLENYDCYEARLKVRNQYNTFSDESTQIITVSYKEIQAPTFFIRPNNADGSIIIDITNPTQEHLAYCEIYRKSDNEEWIRVAKDLGQNDSFTDYGLITKKIYDYKVRAISSQEGFTDSEPKKCSTILNYTQLIDVNDNGKILALRYSPNKTFNFNKPTYTMDYVGRRGISVEYARKQYNSMNCGFTIRDNELNLFLDLFSSGNTLLYRDNRGFKIYGHIINEPQIKIVNNGWCDISFMFVESDYSEVV